MQVYGTKRFVIAFKLHINMLKGLKLIFNYLFSFIDLMSSKGKGFYVPLFHKKNTLNVLLFPNTNWQSYLVPQNQLAKFACSPELAGHVPLFPQNQLPMFPYPQNKLARFPYSLKLSCYVPLSPNTN